MPKLFSESIELGSTGPELPQSPGLRAWPFIPGDGFGRVKPVIDEYTAVQQTIGDTPPPSIAGMTDEQIMQTMQRWMEENPAVKRRLQAYRGFTDLHLELRGDDGKPLGGGAIGLTELPPPPADLPQAHDDFRESGFVGPPYYMLVLPEVDMMDDLRRRGRELREQRDR